ncbi:hypothetical protein [Wenjunlia tyrosinilytica]|uniref:Uncharacterized protein n=1 Tax=Wenjunlia tyrosinilytica TaxID=1544741 RepID=A0A917ZVG4_9ACTN|nr:hypothetical protein [Wenjunlia tyrosinilytica]GGO97498.1 hypothetical protein GCM10012280_59460 [Wenjunlia tyrosinilytica]
MQLRFLGKNSTPGDSPTLYATDRETYVVQGWIVTAGDVLMKLDVPDSETAVEVPTELFEHLANDGLSGAVATWQPPIVHVTEEGNCVVQGVRITDPEALAQMRMPHYESCVEVSKAAIVALLEESAGGTDHK